jgi:hypothetical protein
LRSGKASKQAVWNGMEWNTPVGRQADWLAITVCDSHDSEKKEGKKGLGC